MYAKYFKRPIDFVCSAILITLLLPLYIFISVLVKISMGSPVMFKQTRVGLNEKLFGITKFRSMNNEKDEGGNLLPDSVRLTRVGKFLRKTSLDEIPQFFCVLKGDMSFIGPRPLLPRYLPYYTARERKRHNVRPGITGLAQVNGRNNISWSEKLEFDAQYADNITFWGDVKIALKTLEKVFRGSDVVVGREGFFDVERAKELAKNAKQTPLQNKE